MKKTYSKIQLSAEQTFLTELRGIVEAGRRKGYEAVNQVIVICNWLIGRRIVVQEQQGKERAEYGKHIIDMASKYLTEEFGKGYSKSNLRNFRQFYLLFGSLIPNSPDASGELVDSKIYQTRLANLSWSHYEQLLRGCGSNGHVSAYVRCLGKKQ